MSALRSCGVCRLFVDLEDRSTPAVGEGVNEAVSRWPNVGLVDFVRAALAVVQCGNVVCMVEVEGWFVGWPAITTGEPQCGRLPGGRRWREDAAFVPCDPRRGWIS